jgi:hypothetical protein
MILFDEHLKMSFLVLLTMIDTTTSNRIWTSLQPPPPSTMVKRRGRPARIISQPQTRHEQVRQRAKEIEEQMTLYQQHLAYRRSPQRPIREPREGGHQHQWKTTTLITKWMDLEWRRRWHAARGRTQATSWQTPWSQQVLHLYEGLQKHEATALFLLRTEVLGLNAWLNSIGVPDIPPGCACGWPTQTVQHVLFYCPQYSATRPTLLSQVEAQHLYPLLSGVESAQATARWFIASGSLEQFHTAQQITSEKTRNYIAIPDTATWTSDYDD